MKRIEVTMIELASKAGNLTMEEVLTNVDAKPLPESSWGQHLPRVLIASWGELEPQTRLALFLVGLTAESSRRPVAVEPIRCQKCGTVADTLHDCK